MIFSNLPWWPSSWWLPPENSNQRIFHVEYRTTSEHSTGTSHSNTSPIDTTNLLLRSSLLLRSGLLSCSSLGLGGGLLLGIGRKLVGRLHLYQSSGLDSTLQSRLHYMLLDGSLSITTRVCVNEVSGETMMQGRHSQDITNKKYPRRHDPPTRSYAICRSIDPKM